MRMIRKRNPLSMGGRWLQDITPIKINFVLSTISHLYEMNVIYKYVELMTKSEHDIIIYKKVISPNTYRYNLALKSMVH